MKVVRFLLCFFASSFRDRFDLLAETEEGALICLKAMLKVQLAKPINYPIIPSDKHNQANP